MYEQRARAAGRTGGTAGGGPGARRGRGTRGGGRDRMLLAQLCVCLALFLTVFLGRGLFPGRMAQLGEELRGMIAADFDFRGALASLGGSLAEGETVLSDLGEFCVQVFGPQETEAEPAALLTPPAAPAVLASELSFLSGHPDALERTEHYTRGEALGVTLTAAPAPEETAEQEAVQPQVLPAGAVVQVSDYDGPALPDNYTMDQLSLGELETMAPISGRLTSGYGYRVDPVKGTAGDFHGGVDIAGSEGSPIAAFADGVVEYTGEDNSYGRYFQIDHGNGVKSFYAHCSQVLVQKGQTVARGETVGLVGSTGNVTGPHLHLELKYGKLHLNPAYYVEFLPAE